MPRTKSKPAKVKVWTYLCENWDCQYEGVSTAPGDSAPINCFCGKFIETDSYSEEFMDVEDYEERKAKIIPRPSWYKARRKEIKERGMSPGGTLYCAICDNEIELNADGKEEWTSKGGNYHATSPNIDHFGEDWVERYSRIEADDDYQGMSPNSQKKHMREEYNASPLRVTHMSCNCARPKKRYKS